MHKRISSQICDVTHLFKAKLNNYKLAKLNIFTSLVWWSLLWMESIHWDKVKTDLSNNSDLSWNFQDATKFLFFGVAFYFFLLLLLLNNTSQDIKPLLYVLMELEFTSLWQFHLDRLLCGQVALFKTLDFYPGAN